LQIILVRVIIATSTGQDVRPLCKGAYHPCQEDILLLHPVRARRLCY